MNLCLRLHVAPLLYLAALVTRGPVPGYVVWVKLVLCGRLPAPSSDALWCDVSSWTDNGVYVNAHAKTKFRTLSGPVMLSLLDTMYLTSGTGHMDVKLIRTTLEIMIDKALSSMEPDVVVEHVTAFVQRCNQSYDVHYLLSVLLTHIADVICRHGDHPDQLLRLIHHGARTSGVTPAYAGAPVMSAVQFLRVECMRIMLRGYRDDKTQRILNSMCFTSLHEAAVLGTVDNDISHLGIYLNVRDVMSRTPLYCACVTDNVIVGKALIDRSAEIGDALLISVTNGSAGMAGVLLEHGVVPTMPVFLEAIKHKMTLVVLRIIATYPGLCTTELLMESIRSDYPAAVRAILVTMGDVNITDDQHRTALHTAAIFRANKVYNMLLSMGADTTLCDDENNTAEYYYNKNTS